MLSRFDTYDESDRRRAYGVIKAEQTDRRTHWPYKVNDVQLRELIRPINL